MLVYFRFQSLISIYLWKKEKQNIIVECIDWPGMNKCLGVLVETFPTH